MAINHKQVQAEKSNLLVVDDTPANLRLLVGMLKEYGYKVRPVPSGKLALAAVEANKPDLILLDINMPDLDGYEVCEKLKSADATRDIPVIFLSALNETIDKVKAFSTGGVDYITKPFQIEEVVSRINTHLSLQQLRRDLEDMNRTLEERVQLRTAEVLQLNMEKERIETELRVAGDIQRSMLPSSFPAYPERRDISIHASMVPAKDVGGDFYDFFFIDRTNLFFAIGDVSGKGVPAALFMAMTKTLLKDKALLGLEPDDILLQANKALQQGNETCMFATVFCGILNTEARELRFACGGHNPPLLYTPGKGFCYLDLDESVIVGVFETGKESFPCRKMSLSEQDVLFLYSDGITEAINEKEEFYGEARLQEVLNSLNPEDPAAIIRTVARDVENFAGNAVQADDITMLALKLEK